MKKLLLSVTAAILMTAVFIIIFWSSKENYTETKPSFDLSEESENSDYQSYISYDSTTDSSLMSDSIGELFSPCKELIDGGVYKLVTIKQKLFGGNSVPVKTTTYYGDGFINVIEEEGHGIATETFVDENGTYCFDASTLEIYHMPNLTVVTDTIVTQGLSYMETGSTTVGTSLFTYERYEASDGQIIDYLFAGTQLKKMKLYKGDEYELWGVELSADISEARSYIPENAVIVENK